jgi:hypothetical protein
LTALRVIMPEIFRFPTAGEPHGDAPMPVVDGSYRERPIA